MRTGSHLSNFRTKGANDGSEEDIKPGVDERYVPPPPPRQPSFPFLFLFPERWRGGGVSWVLSTRPPISFDLRKWVTGVGQTCRPADEIALTVEVTVLVTTPFQVQRSFCLDIGDVLLRTHIVSHVRNSCLRLCIEGDHSCPYRAKGMDMGICLVSPPPSAFMAWCLFKQRNYFTFTLEK